MKKLSEVQFEDLEGKSYELIRTVEMLCEICQKPMNIREKSSGSVQIATKDDYENLRRKASTHDRAEIDIDKGKIYFYDHDFPGDVHLGCVEKL